MSDYKKVTIVGAGFVGATTAYNILQKEIADVVLIDIVEGIPQGKALDMMESAPIEKFDTKIIGTNSYEESKDSDIVVITAGLARKPGMSRDDLLAKNANIISDVVEKCVEQSPNAIIIMVSNPLDVMCYIALKKSGFDPKKVIGMAGELDSTRCSYFISEALKCSPKAVRSTVLGGHGDLMVMIPEHTTVDRKPVTELLDKEKIKEIDERTKFGGAEIVKLLKTGSAYYSPGASVTKMVKAILEDSGETIIASIYLDGEYNINGVYSGVPVKLGKEGVKEIIELKLGDEQQKALEESSKHTKKNCEKLTELGITFD